MFEEELKKEKVKRLEQRRNDRKQKRKIEAAEVKKAEEEKLGMNVLSVYSFIWYYQEYIRRRREYLTAQKLFSKF